MGNPQNKSEKITNFNLSSAASMTRGTGMNHSTWESSNLNGKTIYFIRHSQAQHNVTGDHSIHDPRLTMEGVRQAQRICDGIPADALANLQLIVTSPLRRALQSTSLAFHRQIEWQHVPVELMPELQETQNIPCDTGSSSQILFEEFPQFHEQIRKIPVNWFQKTGIMAATNEAFKQRAEHVRRWLINRPEKVIVVMTHNGFLKHLLGDDIMKSTGGLFNNSEVRRLLLLDNGSIQDQGITTLMHNAIDEEIENVGYLD